jgi:GTP-binding protein
MGAVTVDPSAVAPNGEQRRDGGPAGSPGRAQPGEGGKVRPAPDTSRLAAVVLLVDSRHPGLAIDVAADGWLRALGVHRLVVATKFDKLSRSERPRTLAALEQAFQGPVLPVSAATGENLDELWRQILPCVNPTPPR